MDLLSQHESFLRAIYDAPDDDTPRLVYADFLQEQGDADRAAYIRCECELARCGDARVRELGAARRDLVEQHRGRFGSPWPWDHADTDRGFPLPTGRIQIRSKLLADLEKLRETVVRWTPEWFGTTTAQVLPPAIRPEQVEVLLSLPFTQQVREWDFGGHVDEVPAGHETADAGTFGLIDMHEQPVITDSGVEALAGSRAARRITGLVLTHNNLGNDALRALVWSPYLSNLKKLDVSEGNRYEGRTWARLLEKFGEDVVG